MTGPERVVAHARSMLGVRWRHQGRKPWAVDCAGLVVLSFAAAGWPSAESSPARYGREPWDDMLRKTLVGHFGPPLPGGVEWQRGDVALFRWGKSDPSHVGIIADHPAGGLSIIHASNLRNVVETAFTGRLLASVEDVYRPVWGES